jgi:DNA-binding transcriptional ArsR family regulator
MNEKFQVASTAALIADPPRAAMLTTLLDGRAFAAGELARRRSRRSRPACALRSSQWGLVKMAQQGRHRYDRIASPEVAHAIEALGAISTTPTLKPEREAICYAHLL